MDAEALADEIDRRIWELPERSTERVRRIRREYSRRLRQASSDEVLALTLALVDRHRWVAYELLYNHPNGLSSLGVADVERLARGMGNWGSVDAFARYVSGPAWQRGCIPDEVIGRWAASQSRWWRRAALVSTVALNVRSTGGTGDTARTIEVGAQLASDRDDMVVKALSWALRELVVWDADAVRRFLSDHDAVLASRVKREVHNKLETGLKNPTGPHTPLSI